MSFKLERWGRFQCLVVTSRLLSTLSSDHAGYAPCSAIAAHDFVFEQCEVCTTPTTFCFRYDPVGSRTGAVIRKVSPCLFPEFPPSCPSRAHRDPVSSPRHIARSKRISRTGAPRVVWIVFDELDQRALFTARHPGLELPEFDRLRAESFVALNAFAPARGTRRSIASMLLGRQVSWALPSGPSALPCAIEGGGEEAAVDDCWTQHPNLFERVRESGANVGVSGWYHPYCRLFADSLTACTWAGLPYWNSPRVRDSFDQQWHEVVKPLPLANRWLRPGSRIRDAHRDAFERILAAALEMAPDPDLGLAMLHFPVPHHPDIYDPERRALSATDRRSYFDNLELADRTLGEVRDVMEAAGLWDESIVIVTSDHWWRAIHRGDWGLTPEEELVFADEINRRVPFLLKLAKQREASVYPRAFNTLLVHDLILDLLMGGGTTPAAVAAWLDERRATAPVPYLTPTRRRPSGGGARR